MISRGGGDVRSGTVPVCGLQYTTSPCLPSAVKASLGVAPTSTTSASFPSIAAATGGSAAGGAAPARMDPLPQGTLQLYDSYYASLRGTEPAALVTSGSRGEWTGSLCLPEDLSGIGPSARRLLQLDAARQQQQHHQRESGRGTAAKTSRAPTVNAVASRTLPVHARTSRVTGKAPATPATGLSATAPLPAPASHKRGSGTSARAHASSAATRQLERAMDVRPPMMLSTITNAVHTGGGYGGNGGAATTAAAAAPPPLVTQLQSYIRRELVLNSGGAAIPSAMDQLNPYREAFRALGSAFPAYACLFDDIQCAYDNVIQAQAELLTDAYATVVARDVEKMTHQERAAALHQQANALQAELAKMEAALKTRAEAEEDERQQATMLKTRTGRGYDALELRRELEAANQRVAELEHNSQSDLEKIMVLIGAVRECDRRLKEYERLVTSVTGQVSELDEFKRIAGEAQAELQLFRKKYSDYVPVADFRLMKEYLTAELEAAQLMARRWRRTAAVRGTQLEVMQRRLTALEEDRNALVEAAAAAAPSTGGGRGQRSGAEAVLTPRPSWSQLYEQYPELSGYAADVGYLTIALDRDADGIEAIGAGDNHGTGRRASASANFNVGMPVVKGPSETRLQVDYLVRRIAALEAALSAQSSQPQSQQPRQRLSAHVEDGGGAAGDGARVSSRKPSQDISVGARDRSGDAGAPASQQRRNSRRTHGFGDAYHGGASVAIIGTGVPRLAPPLELPLLGLGCGPQVPLCLRASGILTRRSVTPATAVSLVYHFFLDMLPTYMDQEDEVQQRAAGATSGGAAADRLSPFLYELLQSEMQVREELQAYDSVAHLMMNLEKDGEKREWCSDALHLLLWVARGIMPPRIAVDAAVVVAQVKRDIRALAKELQSSRLRRQALGECLQPVLELKTASELAELRAALGGETTFNADTLCNDTHPFMQVLLVQECRSSSELYLAFLRALTARASFLSLGDGRSGTAGATPGAAAAAGAAASVGAATQKGGRDAKAPPAPQLAEGDRVLTLTDISAAVLEVEPGTPEVVLRELSLNAVSANAPLPAAGHTAGETAADAATGTAGATEDATVVVRLSDIVRAVGAAPLIRRTVRSSKEECVL
ncbi:hypothetical protein NESM_000468800 [Novymonas esmeraldas]|uniref:Translin-associated factor X-interacting protein 1 N-terminal domain-containing protein n=1 Tax=Novymonas esmeraldas TaxID=1808958 RepID=A0AAW0EQC6_9TRYP